MCCVYSQLVSKTGPLAVGLSATVEHEVYILHALGGSALEEVVNDRNEHNTTGGAIIVETTEVDSMLSSNLSHFGDVINDRDQAVPLALVELLVAIGRREYKKQGLMVSQMTIREHNYLQPTKNRKYKKKRSKTRPPPQKKKMKKKRE